jgi:hypothetical protein
MLIRAATTVIANYVSLDVYIDKVETNAIVKVSQSMDAEKNIPKKIRSFLTQDEVIEASFHLTGCQLYATDQRLVMTSGRTTRDFDYKHISSIAYETKRYRYLIVIGAVFIIVGLGAGDTWAAVLGLLGLLLIIAGAFAKSERIELNVVGISTPILFQGSRQELDSLFQTVRQKRKSSS